MASAGKTFGVQSPSLTASGQDEPMGVSGISGHKPQAVPDAEQRKDYFKGTSMDTDAPSETQTTTAPAEKIKQD